MLVLAPPANRVHLFRKPPFVGRHRHPMAASVRKWVGCWDVTCLTAILEPCPENNVPYRASLPPDAAEGCARPTALPLAVRSRPDSTARAQSCWSGHGCFGHPALSAHPCAPIGTPGFRKFTAISRLVLRELRLNSWPQKIGRFRDGHSKSSVKRQLRSSSDSGELLLKDGVHLVERHAIVVNAQCRAETEIIRLIRLFAIEEPSQCTKRPRCVAISHRQMIM